MSKKRRPTPTLPITGLKGILPKPAAPVTSEDMKERGGPLDPATLEARDAQRDLGAELLAAIRQVKADLSARQAEPPGGALKGGALALAPADQDCFAKALLSPPPPAPALDRAFGRRRKLLRTE